MRKKLLGVLFAIGIIPSAIYLGNYLVVSPDVGMAVLVGIVPALVCCFVIERDRSDRAFLLKVVVAALVVRWFLAFLIFIYNRQAFFGGDAETYDVFGNALSQSWSGLVDPKSSWLLRYTEINRSGWGMFYYVAAVYHTIGRNPLAIQLINAGLGAALCIAVYRIAMMVYPEQRVARVAALLTAFSPSLILWSSQELKDAPIALCLCLCILFTLKLREKFNALSLVLLVAFLFCLFSLRHYAFYIAFVSIAGTFIVAAKRFTPLRIAQGGLLVLVLGVSLAYFGATGVDPAAFDPQVIQRARVWGAAAATSGFGGDVDITDPHAALAFLPLGILHVLFAPFPWTITNLRQFITLPELLIWWAFVPIMLRGYWFAIRHRLRESFGICLFSIGLILAYALYQSNAGTAYRHRAQLYGFFFVFIAIGLELRRAAKLKKRLHTGFNRPSFAAAGTAGASGQFASVRATGPNFRVRS
ncbi:MAG TPA: glycosyltransferase family 39 protein [Blastocatellia bacterium]|jgi:hypothetical protein